MKFGIGASVRRKEDSAFITGKGHYLSDSRPDDTTWAQVVRSPVGHARFRIENRDDVAAMPGVHAVLTSDDVAHLNANPCVGQAPNSDGSKLDVPRFPILAEGAYLVVPPALNVTARELFVSTNLNTGGSSTTVP